mmetsp:Transcript_100323/g.189259  ORF Transcript_100323/g.189259 Transcript_100323/m.189259 type:complete len:213 (+) Transcript_100323:397-1035(+)
MRAVRASRPGRKPAAFRAAAMSPSSSDICSASPGCLAGLSVDATLVRLGNVSDATAGASASEDAAMPAGSCRWRASPPEDVGLHMSSCFVLASHISRSLSISSSINGFRATEALCALAASARLFNAPTMSLSSLLDAIIGRVPTMPVSSAVAAGALLPALEGRESYTRGSGPGNACSVPALQCSKLALLSALEGLESRRSCGPGTACLPLEL